MYPIPPNATRVRYLQSDGSANIKMLLPVGLSAGYAAMAVDMEFVTAPTSTAGCGYYQTTNRLFAGRITSGTAYEKLAFRVRGKDCYSTTTSDAGRHRYYADTQTGAVTFDGSSIAASGTSGTITVTAVGVFGRTNNNGTAWEAYGTPMRVYSFKFWKNGVLIYDLVPIRVGTTGAMFNRATGETIYNQSTGSFVLGPDTFQQGVVPTRMTVNGTLVRSYVPVRVGSVGYLFDRVSGQLFGNAGTGAFTLGPDK